MSIHRGDFHPSPPAPRPTAGKVRFWRSFHPLNDFSSFALLRSVVSTIEFATFALEMAAMPTSAAPKVRRTGSCSL